MHAFVRAVGTCVPKRVMTNDELSKQIDTSDEWIYSHTGIRNRHIAAAGISASDMALDAARAAMENAGVSPLEIDLILVATSTPDYVGFPSTAALVQEKLGAESAGAMDITAACTGFIYGLETAKAFIESRSARNVLVIGSEIFSRILDWGDRNTCVLFGDGAGAALVSATNGEYSRIDTGLLRSQGSGERYLYVADGDSGHRCNAAVADSVVHMNGRQVYNFAVKALCDTIEFLVSKNGTRLESIDYIVPHQANIRIIEAAGKRVGIPKETFYTNMEEYGNTSAASIPIALNEMLEKNLLKRGDIILTIGFGGGLTYGGNLIHW